MTEGEFRKSQDDAIRRMREMNGRANENRGNVGIPPSPDFVRLRNNTPTVKSVSQINENKPNNSNSFINSHTSQSSGFNLPFLDSVLKDGDSTLIIGLLLLLMSEKTDKILLFALVYILL